MVGDRGSGDREPEGRVREEDVDRTGQRVKDRGHSIMGSRHWGAGFKETQGTNLSPRDTETEP